MATKFLRDEKKTYPLTWMVAGGLFFGSAVWALYAEMVTRVPWQEHQKAFFDLELEQSRQGLARAQDDWDKQIAPSLKDKIARKEEIEQSQKAGAYKQALDRKLQLDADFGDAERAKTFGGSDLDEAYYYRNLAEYHRDAAGNEARHLIHEAFAGDDKAKGEELAARIWADPPAPAQGDETPKMHHLTAEIARMQAHIAQIDQAMNEVPQQVRRALRDARAAEADVVEKLKVEVKHQKRVDDALAAMARIDGPADPPLTEKDPVKRAEEKTRERTRVCQGKEDTRNCIIWLKLEPVDAEHKQLDVEIAKRRRGLADAELRAGKAEERAHPKFSPEAAIKSLVGPFQIQQVVMSWIDYERDVDKEQVDRCQTCHMGIDNGSYPSAAIPRQFRTHPNRSVLFASHPVEKFGCTSCHQGQGRATDSLAHSSWHLEEHHGEERWHFQGDHYWEDPLLPVGRLTKLVVDDDDDELAVKLGKGKWETLKLDHKNAEAHHADPTVDDAYKDEGELFAALQEKLAKVVEADGDVKANWHAVVRKLDNRVQIGVEPNDPTKAVDPKSIPTVAVKFVDPELAETLGFTGVVETTTKAPLHTAKAPPSLPVRGRGMASVGKDGRFHPPRGADGLQIPDETRNRFIEALPEVEAGCLRCHQTDADLRPRRSDAKYVTAKLAYEKAEASRKADPQGYRKSHDGSDDLPAVAPDPSEGFDLAPTFADGRALFRSLNCTGCHILDGYPWDRNTGPNLDNVTAKVAPEWILTWLRNPRGWRAKTSMPNLWPKLLDPASKRPYPPGSPEYAKWEATMREETVAVASFLVERSDNPSTRPGAPKDAQPLKATVTGYAEVVGATAEKGKVIFESYGCQGCHAREDVDTAGEKLPEPWRSRERDAAPTLANMAAKTTADWIAYWVEDPSRYWHGTKMPNLRLSREEAASVGKYVASLKSPPLDAAKVDAADVAIVADPTKRNERVPCASTGGTVMTRAECGEKLVAYYGCFGCHGISGFENSAPVAPELGGFAKKDVTTLDFGYALADHHLHTTETFATLKLDSPRIFRRDRIELRMGDFDLSPREIRSLVVFLKGLTQSKPKPAFNPSQRPGYSTTLDGRLLVVDLNCRGCHVIEGRGGDIDGFRQSQLSSDSQQRAPFLTGEGMRVQPEWLFTFLRDPGKNGIRPWLHPEWAWGNDVPDDKKALRMPTFSLTNEQVTAIVRYFATWDGQEYPYQVPKAAEQTEEQRLYALAHMNDAKTGNCLSCHFQGEFPVERGKSELAKMAPNFNNVHRRLRPEWVKAWLLRPANWLPYTKMTAFWATVDREKDNPFWPAESDPFRSPAPAWDKVPWPGGAITTEEQVEAVRDFLFSLKDGDVFPRAGEEADSPLVKRAGAEAPKPEAAAEGKGKDKKDKDKKPKKTGSVPGPARF